jgi:hypothetical protein
MGNPSVTSVVSSKRSFTMEYISVISGWFVPLKVIPEVRITLAIFIGLVFLGILAKRKIRILNIGFFFLFVTYLVGRSYYSNVDYHESERYLSLVYPFFVIGFLVPILEWVYSLDNILLKRMVGIFSISLIVYSTFRSIWNDIIWF